MTVTQHHHHSQRSLPEIAGNVIDQVTRLFRMEVQLVRAETSEKISNLRGAIVTIAAGAFVLLAALVVLLGACVVWLQYAGIDVRWASLIVAGTALLIGLALVQMGMSDFRASRLTPDRSMEQLRRDAQTAQEQVQ